MPDKKVDGAEKGPVSTATLERKIQQYLDLLPEGLQRPWRDRFEKSDDVDLPALEKSIGEFVEKRDRALMGKAASMFDGMTHLVKDHEAIAKTLEVIREAEGRPELYVGDGKTAHVYRDPYTPALCYKYVHNFQEYSAWNNVDREAHYLEDLGDIVVDGARVPRLNGVIDLPDTKVIGMEYLNAPSVDMILERKRPLPEGFDVKLFLKKLRAYVVTMHARNIYHRDLHKGNVLIGPDSTPYIIDFGRAVRSINADHAYEAFDRTGSIRTFLPSDETWVDTLEMQLRIRLNGETRQ